MPNPDEPKKARRFPDTIPEDEMNATMKEWDLSGLDVRDRGNIVICGAHDGVIYQKVGSDWVMVDFLTIKTLLAEILNEQTAKSAVNSIRTMGMQNEMFGKVAAKAYKDSLAEFTTEHPIDNK